MVTLLSSTSLHTDQSRAACRWWRANCSMITAKRSQVMSLCHLVSCLSPNNRTRRDPVRMCGAWSLAALRRFCGAGKWQNPHDPRQQSVHRKWWSNSIFTGACEGKSETWGKPGRQNWVERFLIVGNLLAKWNLKARRVTFQGIYWHEMEFEKIHMYVFFRQSH